MSAVVLAAALLSLGLYGVLTRRDLIAVLASIEVMIAGSLLMLVALASATRAGNAASPATVEAVGLLVLVVAAAEAAVGLALLVAVARRRGTTAVDELTEVRG